NPFRRRHSTSFPTLPPIASVPLDPVTRGYDRPLQTFTSRPADDAVPAALTRLDGGGTLSAPIPEKESPTVADEPAREGSSSCCRFGQRSWCSVPMERIGSKKKRGFREAGGVATLPVPDRQPPYAPEAELAVLGGMLIDPDAVSKAIEILDDSMFYREANRRVFRAMARLFQAGQVVDPVTVS